MERSSTDNADLRGAPHEGKSSECSLRNSTDPAIGGKDNRSGPRLWIGDVVHVNVIVKSALGDWQAKLDNISDNGMAVRLGDGVLDLEDGAEVHGAIAAGRMSREFQGIVVWTGQSDSGFSRAGIRFLTAAPSVEWVVASAMAGEDVG